MTVPVDPLERMVDFEFPSAKPIAVPVTSVVMETRGSMMDRIRRITEWHRRWFRFHREVVISTDNPGIPGTTFVQCQSPPPHLCKSWYSDMCIRWMDKLCEAKFLLVWQWDGFIINPEIWTDEFMRWDYVAAPVIIGYWREAARWLASVRRDWKNPIPTRVPSWVGDGGFSLRSRKFLDSSVTCADTNALTMYSKEDMYLCIEKRCAMEDMGVKYCPVGLASRFAKSDGDRRTLAECFGFHGCDSLDAVKKYLEAKHIKSPVQSNLGVAS